MNTSPEHFDHHGVSEWPDHATKKQQKTGQLFRNCKEAPLTTNARTAGRQTRYHPSKRTGESTVSKHYFVAVCPEITRFQPVLIASLPRFNSLQSRMAASPELFRNREEN